MPVPVVQSAQEKKKLWSVITASSVGTLIEWYDFYIFGSLAATLSLHFFPESDQFAGLLKTLAIFAVGFIVRPFGALVFGRLGDIVGRKYTFLVTLILMGASTFLIGLVPSYKTIGAFAPFLVLLLRVVQGLALGGEYGGAATYVAEHAPEGKKGFYTSFIQTTATLGLFVSLGVILAVRLSLSADDFNSWGWRIPFLLSAVLVGISIYIRLRMEESPLFAKIKKEGKTSANPIKESFGKKENLKIVLLALFGAAAGQGVVWYTGQFYALSFIQTTCKIEFVQSYYIVAIALAIGTPLFIFFGGWSDKVGRKYIMMAALLLAVVLYRPIYSSMYSVADIQQLRENELERDIRSSTSYNAARDTIRSVTTRFHFADGTLKKETKTTTLQADASQPPVAPATKTEIILSNTKFWTMVALIVVQVILVTMVYGPIAAFLVELFPTRIRYTSMSLPYHIGNGVFGGLTPLIATWMAGRSSDPLVGLWYPIGVALITFVIGMIFLKNRAVAES
jgi:MHS family proline/betaine transporter-like MFS transporter